VVRPSTELMMALRSLGLVTLRMILVLHWEIMFLSTLAGRWLTMQRPIPNFLPSDATVLSMLEETALPNPRSGQ